MSVPPASAIAEPPPRDGRSWPVRPAIELDDIDLVLFTQVRKPSIELVMDEVGIPRERTHTVMEKWGYTGSACVPIALDEALELGKIASGDLVMIPSPSVLLDDESAAVAVLRIVDALEDHDDVQQVWANFDISDEDMEGLA